MTKHNLLIYSIIFIFLSIILISCSTNNEYTKSESELFSEEAATNDDTSSIASADIDSTPDNDVGDNDDNANTNIIVVPETHYIVCIDAGHQQNNDSSTEPIGPGASESKPKVSAGTCGTISGVPEYELNLTLAQLLQEALEDKGYTVVMCRTQNDVHISNSERAQIANSVGADIFIRIHANGSGDSSAHGAMTICQTSNNPYNAELYEESKLLSELILDELVSSTGCTREYVWETDTMTGINWSQVPTTIVEVGYMTNPEEEALLLSDSYQQLIITGLVNGIDKYFIEHSNNK